MPQNKEKLKAIKAFVFDMDGTLWLGNKRIKGAKEIISFLAEKTFAFYFFTNNSSKNPKEYVNKLKRMGLGAFNIDRIMTSGDVTAAYIKKRTKQPSVYVCGTKALKKQLRKAGIRVVEKSGQVIDYAVLGFDRELTFSKLTILVDYIMDGVPYLATNTDDVCPLEKGRFLVDCRSMAKMIENATGKTPKYLGKPEAATVDYIVSATGLKPNEIAMVGDRLYTDIATAKKGGMLGVAVLSGETNKSDIKSSEIKPDLVYNSVAELLQDLKEIFDE
ncbi:MAG: HAD-IIA family hydrolase [Eubacteriales bacterium]